MSQQYPFQCNIAQALNIYRRQMVSAHSAWYYERTPDL